ncbi:hypothetical protein F52700_3174 [Fusarium sp. NRRL 52700]|nr:hypothetical protein F52700_3174 [Fusarium sp. NRRL 52700]
MHPTATQQIATAVRATFKEQRSSSLEIWFLPEESFEHHNWGNILANLQVFANPYAEYLTEVRSRYTDLTYKNIGALDPESRPDRATPSTSFFFGGEHRTVTLIASAAEEAVIIPDPFSAWQPKDDDLETYGIPADGTLKGHYLVHYLEPQIASGVPDAGQAIARITRDLTNRFHFAEQKFINAGVSIEQRIQAALESDDTDRVQCLEDNKEGKCLEAFVATAAEPIYHLLEGPSAKAATYLADQPPSLKRAATAEALDLDLRRRDGEDDLVWYQRLSTWVRDNAEMAVADGGSHRGPEFPAVALPARIPTWLSTVCILVDKTLRPSGQFHKFLNGLFTPGYYDKETKTQAPATIAVPNYPGIEVNLYHSPDDTTARTKRNAITNINARAEAVNEALFPGLARAYLEEEFDGKVKGLVERLKETPCGYAFVTGGPGSGKTTTAMNLVAAIVSGGVGETRQHQPKPTVAVGSEPVTSDKPESVASDKPESTGWMDDDNDDTFSEASFCSAVSYLAVGLGSDQLEQEHITSAHSFDVCDDTTMPSDYRALPTESGPNLECGLYALMKSMQHQMPDGASTLNSVDDLWSLVDSPEYTQMMAISQGSGSSNMSVDELACVLKLWSEREGSIPLQLAIVVDGNPPISMPIFASPIQDRFKQAYKNKVLAPPMVHYTPPLPPPPEDPEIKSARLQAIMRDDLVEHYHRPSFKMFRSQKSYMMSDKEIGDLIEQIVKDAHEQIHVPEPARERHTSAYAVLMEHPFAEKPLGPALHGLDIGQLTENQGNQITFNIKDQATS